MKSPVTMRAVQLSRFGDPDVLEVVELPAPSPGPGEVLVKIRAAGVNFFETLVRRNRYAFTPELPMVPGVEAAGVVEVIGPGVDPNLLGARVAIPLFAIGRPSGGYAEFIAAKGSDVVPLPDTLSFEDATALLVQGLSAFHLVRQAAPQGKSVIITAAAGGVGTLLIQLAKCNQAKLVIGLASTAEKLALAKSAGAHSVFDYSLPNWIDQLKETTAGAGADIIYDSVGGPVTASLLGVLAPLGQLIFAALNRWSLTTKDLEGMFHRNQSVRGFALLPLLSPGSVRRDLASLFNLVASGQLKVSATRRYPLTRAADAHHALENRLTTGKVVLIP